MKRLFFISITAFSLFSAQSMAAEGMVVIKSSYAAKATMDRVESIAQQRDLTVFARIDHAAGAASIGKTLRANEVIIFGHPRGGTAFMECAQTVGIDLPLKILVWEDDASQVWLGYNHPAYLAQRHDVPECPTIENMSNALATIAETAVSQ